MSAESYGTSPAKRFRRTRAQITQLRDALYVMVEAQQPMTVRQAFYRGVGFGLWPKTEAAYKTVCRLLAEMRGDGALPYSWIADNTRWMRKPTTFDSMEAALRNAAATYRRSLWTSQDTYLEVWLEKEALAGVGVDITGPWDVALMVTRGYPSITFLHSAAETIRATAGVDLVADICRGRDDDCYATWALGYLSMHPDADEEALRRASFHQTKNVTILYVGDRDPSGDDIARNVEARLAELSGADIDFCRVAVTAAQVDDYQLPTRPTKRTDSRAKTWDGNGSVEVDAIEPDVLRDLINTEIESCVDLDALQVVQLAETEERELARRIVEREFVA